MTGSELRRVIRGFRREQVVTTALQLFGRTGSLDASMEEIAAEAGVSRSTVYNHFADRGELLAACAAHAHDRLAAAMRRAIEREGDAVTILTGFLAAALTSLDENPGFYRLATSLAAGRSVAEAVLDGELAAAGASAESQVDALVARLADDLAVDAPVAVSVIGVVLLGALEQRARQSEPPPAEATAAILARALLSGIAGTPR